MTVAQTLKFRIEITFGHEVLSATLNHADTKIVGCVSLSV